MTTTTSGSALFEQLQAVAAARPGADYTDLPAGDRAVIDRGVTAIHEHAGADGMAELLDTGVVDPVVQHLIVLLEQANQRSFLTGAAPPDDGHEALLTPIAPDVAAVVAAVGALPLPAGELGQRWTCHTTTVAWLRSRRSAHTRRAYFRDLAGWLGWLAARGLDPRAARRGDVDAYLADLAASDRPPAASTVNRRLSTLSSWYGYLADHDLVERNPVAAVDRPALDRDFSPTVGLTVDEVRALLRAADAVVERRRSHGEGDLFTAKRDRVLVGMLAGLGLRVGEAIGLDLSDLRVNQGHRTVVVRGKGGRTRELPLPAELGRLIDDHLPKQRRTLALARVEREYQPRLRAERAELLQNLDHGILPPKAIRRGLTAEDIRDRGYLNGLLPSGREYDEQWWMAAHELSAADLERQVRTGPLFATHTGTRLTQAAVFATVRRLARAAGLSVAERISPHSLRHTAATAALDDGAPLRDVQDFLGHADPRTTRRYDRNRGSLDRSPAHRLGVLYAE